MSNNYFKKKSYKSERVGSWLYEWYVADKHPERSFMRVSGESGLFELRIKANSHVFGYLLAAAEKGLTEQLHGWITLVYIPAMAMTQDQGLTDDISKSIQKWMKRRESEAESAAKAVTNEQEQADQAYMEDIASEQGMSKKELKAKRETDKEAMREVLNEVKEDKS